jgi:hypothetical protein
MARINKIFPDGFDPGRKHQILIMKKLLNLPVKITGFFLKVINAG